MLRLRSHFDSLNVSPLRIASAGLIGITLGGAFFATVWLKPDLLRVEKVHFDGNYRATDVSLRHLTNIRNGSFWWDVDLEQAVHGVEKHPWVRVATVHRSFPNYLTFTVEEHKPVAMVVGEQLTYVNERGEQFLVANSSAVDFPLITGLTREVRDAHPELPDAIVQEGVQLLKTLDDKDLIGPADISEVSFDRALGWTVFVEGGARFLFGFDDLTRQTQRLAQLIETELSIFDSVVVDLAPATVAIVKPLGPRSEG